MGDELKAALADNIKQREKMANELAAALGTVSVVN
jgi:hypothetical protein